MIDLKCRRRSNNQFNRCSLNMQDKIDCNKINEIREKRNANSIYIGSFTSRAYVQSSSNLLEIFHYLCKLFTISEHTMGFLSIVFRILTSQKTNNLLITTIFLECTKEFLSFRNDNTNWRSYKNTQLICKYLANSYLESIWQLSSLFQISLYFSKSDTHIYRLIVPFQNGLKRCVQKSFLKFSH